MDYDGLRRVLGVVPHTARRAPPGYEQDAVCLLLMEHTQTMLLVIQKADREGYRWRHHVALPGGGLEPVDRDATDAALRELYEELAIDRADVDVLGSLGHFQTYSSKNDLEVIVGCWTRPSEVCVDCREIERVLELSLADLIELHVDRGFSGRSSSEIGDALVYALPDARIWGVTARIIHAFLELVLNHRVLA